MSDAVISLTASLVREYLSRKGLKSTLQTLDEEMPRTDDSISNRAQLAKEMHIEKLMKKNKELPEPFRTMLEVMVKYIKEQGGLSSSSSVVADKVHERPRSSRGARKDTGNKALAQPSNSDITNQSEKLDDKDDRKGYDDLLKQLEKPARNIPATKPSLLTNDLRIKLNSDESHSTAGNTNTPVSTGSSGFSEPSMTTPSMSSDPKAKLKSKRRPNATGGPVISSGLAGKRDSRLRPGSGRLSSSLSGLNNGSLFGDDDESKEQNIAQNQKLDVQENHIDRLPRSQDFSLDQSSKDRHQLGDISSRESRKSTSKRSSTRKKYVAAGRENYQPDFGSFMGLKNLIFGTATASFNPEWRNQSFSFCDLYQLEYGIVQLKGGPCGVLAAVQGFVLKHLLFGGKKGDTKKKLQPSSRERTKALTSALSEILWRAGDHKTATVALPTGGSNFFGAGRYKPDQLTEALVLHDFKSSESLQSFLAQNITQFESDKSSGCILLLYSVMLSRSIQKVILDMDEPTNTLMGAHGYCTQEMVNLIVTGKASSNTFDNIMEIDTGGAKKNVFKGIEKQSDIGLLSLFEHYKSCEVGVNFKSPKFPIWVICSESHFSVLFSVDRNLLDDWKFEKTFDLYYYDGLARQEEEIKLTIDTTRECPEYKDTDLVPPLEHCIRTRWKNAVVDWNGTEPIL
ncbi:probable ubiquitin carboxyl-terminal hydrolase MINDY-4 [Stylophora pistillata]|uniref:probable ubiquitin carboxyl-terminal hydrolase MINDY-4 n=1 Tax=Stylophora pistillata TaxID=50429 RepID=UPI000C05334F|nr:probable ubiquitin carboxyl-terminal hydrolase MINDY-4 [Stylophora pistillata]